MICCVLLRYTLVMMAGGYGHNQDDDGRTKMRLISDGKLAKDTNKSSTTQTTASSNQGILALILSHSVVLTRILRRGNESISRTIGSK